MGSKHRNTLRAKQQKLLDDLRSQIEFWYLSEKLTSGDIQQKLNTAKIDVTIGQIHYALRRFDFKRPRNAKSPRYKIAASKRVYITKECKFCHSAHTPKNATQLFCKECAPDGISRSRIQKYGVSAKEIIQLLQDQNFGCGICKCPITFEIVNVDHNHKTGKVRGLLCKMCNLRLSVIEDEAYVQRAKDYLKGESNVSS